jgi:DNA-binding PadR family transcriptional regulator
MTVLRHLHDEPTAELSGADVMKRTGLGSGSAYPILAVLEERGLLTSRWESETPQELQRPRRRLYRLTDHGTQVFEAVLDEMQPRQRKLSLRDSEA